MMGDVDALDRAVWEAVRDRPDRKGLPVDEISDRIGAGDRAAVMAAVDRLVDAGRLYWRNPRVRRRLLHVPEVSHVSGPAPVPGLF